MPRLPDPPPPAHPPAQSPTPASRPGDSYVQSFARGLQVIRSFSASAPQQTLTEVAGRAGLTRAGARRILLTLQALGYVDGDGKQFRLTPRILDLGFAYLSSTPFWDLAEPCVEDLVTAVKESSSVAVLDGNDIVYVLRVPTYKIMRITLGIGSRLPAYATSMGRMLLAGLEDAEAQARLEASCVTPGRAQPALAQLTSRTQTRVDAVMAAVRSARRQGWCLVDQELEEGLISMAAPIKDRQGRMVAALNISGQANRTSARVMRDTMLQPLLDAARAISERVSLRG